MISVSLAWCCPKLAKDCPIFSYTTAGEPRCQSLLHRVSSGVAVRLPRDRSRLLRSSVQGQPPKLLHNQLSSGGLATWITPAPAG